MTADSDQPFLDTDQITLTELDARVYEAIATLEFIGYQVKTADIATSAGLDESTARRALRSLTRRGVLVAKGRSTDPSYEPAYRGWSAAPEQAANPKR
ncbi:MAG TPA: helix-turn-helix domain-containing protein [Streptosporangiaceae bacterium]|nr:helix-turn-helix domain-containing protein [Streptosporangiaceae bacterium]